MSAPRPNAATTSPHLAGLLAAAAVVVAWSIHFWPHLHTANEAIRLYFVQALVDHGTVALDPVCAMHGSIPVDRAEHGGRILLDKAPGLSLLLVPIYAALQTLWPAVRRQDFWLFGYIGTLLAVLLPLCLALWQLQRWWRQRDVPPTAAGLGLLLLLLASPLLVYGGLLFGHGLAAALIAGAVFGLAGAPPQPGPRAWAVGAAAGYAGVVETPVFVLAAMIVVWALARATAAQGSWRAGVAAAGPVAAGVAAGAALQLGYNWLVFGDPLLFAYAFKGDANLASIHDSGLLGFRLPSAEALWGLTFGAARGVFYHAPWLLAALAGLVAAARGPEQTPLRQDARAILAMTFAYFLVIASFVDWRAGDAVGARHLLPLVPLVGAGLPLLLPLSRWPLRAAALLAARSALAAAAAMGVLLHLPSAAGFPYHPDRLLYPVFELAWPVVTAFASYAPSWGSLAGLPGPWAFALQIAIILATFAVWTWWAVRDDASLRAGATHAAGLALVGVILWLAALVAPLGKPGRAVQAARFLATSSLQPGLASRGRMAEDPEGRLARALPARRAMRRPPSAARRRVP